MASKNKEQEQTDIVMEDGMSYEDAVKSMMENYPQLCEALDTQVPLRELMWDLFAAIVAQHVVEYTVPQYGDYPHDQVTNFSVHDMNVQLKRYCNRLESNARGEEETLRDYLKIANYAGLAYLKLADLESKFVLPMDTTEETSEDEAA